MLAFRKREREPVLTIGSGERVRNARDALAGVSLPHA